MNALSALYATGLGFGLGVVTGMPLGVINVAIVDAAAAGRRRFATGLGLGGGAADTVHAALAFAGTARLVTADPQLVRGLAIAAAITIIGYAVVARRYRRLVNQRGEARAAAVAAASGSAGPPADGHLGRGVATGLLLTLPNPAALAAWVAVAAAVWPDASPLSVALIAGGVGVGSALWFAMLARAIGRVRPDHPVLTAIPRVALVLLIAIAIAGVTRALG